MRKIKFDYSKAIGFINQHEVDSMQAYVDQAHKMIHEKIGLGNDFLGWVDLPKNYNKDEFDRISDLIISSFTLDMQAIDVLDDARKYYTERILSSIMRFPIRSERISKLKDLDLSIYHKYKKANSWKERLKFFLLRNKFFLLYDFLINLRKQS